MQQVLFVPEPIIRQEESFEYPGLITGADVVNRQIEEAEYTRWYCIKEILCEQYLWDMRCWDKPKYLYTKEEIILQIRKWLKDHEEGNWTNNCGHCLYCIRRLVDRREATIEDIAGFVMRNNNIKYYNQIKTWNYGFEQ